MNANVASASRGVAKDPSTAAGAAVLALDVAADAAVSSVQIASKAAVDAARTALIESVRADKAAKKAEVERLKKIADLLRCSGADTKAAKAARVLAKVNADAASILVEANSILALSNIEVNAESARISVLVAADKATATREINKNPDAQAKADAASLSVSVAADATVLANQIAKLEAVRAVRTASKVAVDSDRAAKRAAFYAIEEANTDCTGPEPVTVIATMLARRLVFETANTLRDVNALKAKVLAQVVAEKARVSVIVAATVARLTREGKTAEAGAVAADAAVLVHPHFD